jgi:hypothetical protein
MKDPVVHLLSRLKSSLLIPINIIREGVTTLKLVGPLDNSLDRVGPGFVRTVGLLARVRPRVSKLSDRVGARLEPPVRLNDYDKSSQSSLVIRT